ncbi:MAG: hypothetical protein BGO55_20105 [Sphingobacteriales bacterium 50-39]|nr:MAG: hypothetical protein BGO55_20105 [Sphingobacteriales bacterium 50-39]
MTDTILRSDYFKDQPPVLVDIGASGEINAKWKPIAPYCVCLAYDADDREFHVTEQTNKTYRKLLTINRIVTAAPVQQTDFYLTASPFCSSLLEPDNGKLEPWIFSDLFTVQRSTRLHSVTIESSLREAGIGYIDWFKTDTQGTDLRLFNSLPDHLQAGILTAELEPGIIDAYKGEDKLFSVMETLPRKGFWLSSMQVMGIQRLHRNYTAGLSSFVSQRMLRKSPGWAEVTYLRQPFPGTVRQLLLLYVFAWLEKQYGYALEIADYAIRQYPSEAIFTEIRTAALKQLRAGQRTAPLVFLKRQVNKLFSRIHD